MQWADMLSGGPDLCSSASGWNGALIRRWRGTSPDMEQPTLDHSYIAMHLGGPKRVHRWRDGARIAVEADVGSLTVVPAGTAFSWRTEGPIGFAHVYLSPALLARVVHEEFDRDPRQAQLIDAVGREAPLICALFQGMLDEIERPSFATRLLLDTLLHAFVVRLLCECSTLPVARPGVAGGLTPRRLNRVIDYIETNLAADLRLADLASVAASSPYHFSRAFGASTGLPPHRYVTRRRIERAIDLLREDRIAVAEVAARCGFNSQRQFALMFKRVCGVSPSQFRRGR